MKSVLLVCLGNICRSPSAEAVLRRKLRHRPDILIDSAGTGGWHRGEPPDPRATKEGEKRGFDLSALRARQIRVDDYARFDLILGMDRSNLNDIIDRAPAPSPARLALFCAEAGLGSVDVPDPYYGADRGFADMYDLIERAAENLVARYW